MKKPIRQIFREFGRYLNVPYLTLMAKVAKVATMNSESQITDVQTCALADLSAT